MNWIKKIFGIGKKEETEETITEKQDNIPEQDASLSSIPARDSGKICDYCGFSIYDNQKSISKFGKNYHVKPCWRELLKGGKKELFK